MSKPYTRTPAPPALGWAGFASRLIEVDGAPVHARVSVPEPGAPARPALLLLHGFPQSHVMWRRVAERLADEFFIVMPDLRGYGDSSKPPGAPDHGNYSKRALAQELAGVMDALGLREFFLAGHDRGARVAHRLALDHPARVKKLCLLDIVPTLDMFDGPWLRSPADFARDYHHWFHMQQPAPAAEHMMGALDGATARSYLRARLDGGPHIGLGHLEAGALAEYERTFCQPAALHGACEDYRAAATIDRVHDRQSRADGQRLRCDTRVLWGTRGALPLYFDVLATWRPQVDGRLDGEGVEAGHFIPEEQPGLTADRLRSFFV